MKVETKFDINQKVYVIVDKSLEKKTIGSFTVYEDHDIVYDFREGMCIEEDHIFSDYDEAKEALLKMLSDAMDMEFLEE